jgi:ferric-dicitrate binding protein FerR (iron transport regulator)
MSDCQKARELIERFVDGTISSDQEQELNSHAETCQTCREEIAHVTLVGEVIGDAFTPQTTAVQARPRVLAALPESPETSRTRLTWRLWTRNAVAAAVLLAAGLLIGLAADRPPRPEPPASPPLLPVAMRVSEIEGIVLVRHQGSDAWQPVEPNAPVYLGDTFHPTARATMVLALQDDSTIKLDQNSMLALTSYNGTTQFFLEHGECTANLESPHGRFFISTPHGRVEALGTEFTVTVTDE